VKKYIEIVMVALVVAVLGLNVNAADIWPLSVAEAMLHPGSTHCAEFTHEDLTSTTDNGSQTNITLFPVAANTMVRMMAMVLVTPFDDAAYSADNSTLVEVGDGDDSDYYLTSTEVNENNASCVYLKEGRTTWNTTGLTNGVILNSGAKVYTAADTIDFKFSSGSASYALADLDSGKVRFYFQVTERQTK